MSREQVHANVGFARAFALVAPPLDDSTLQIDVDTLVAVLEALPSYAEVDLTFITGDRRQDYHLMARDIPGPDRRFTCLTTGTEWFNIAGIITGWEPDFVTVTKHAEERPVLFVSL